MEIEVKIDKTGESYNEFICNESDILFFHSNTFKRLFESYAADESCYLVATNEKQKVVGVLPSFVSYSEKFGGVINSLPFFGSNGGILANNNEWSIKKALLDAFEQIAIQKKCVSSTIITSPFDADIAFYDKYFKATYRSEKTGLITLLDSDREKLMQSLNTKTRNCIRKAYKSNIDYAINNSITSFDFLFNVHKLNSEAIGGVVKEKSFFDSITNTLVPNRDFNLFVAWMERQPIAALLVLYYNSTVEYFTPVTLSEYRIYQPTSLLIVEAMLDAGKRGYRYWNWGGTNPSQKNIYEFKRKWNPIHMQYYCLTKIYDPRIYSWSKKEIKQEFPDYYVIPFNALDETMCRC